jgi:hypothetical protein
MMSGLLRKKKVSSAVPSVLIWWLVGISRGAPLAFSERCRLLLYPTPSGESMHNR